MSEIPRLLALKVDVDTYRGTCEGVPRLVELLKKYGAQATFLFSLGPDPVSYTHLRAHETVLDLVCRLLLEKKKTNTTSSSIGHS